MGHVIVIGAGAAGMAAAISAAQNGHRVSVFEKNKKAGRKLAITGKGRCNITNASDMRTLMEQVKTNARFLYGAFNRFTNEDILRLLKEEGCETKIERGMRAFPVSDRAADVVEALTGRMRREGVSLCFEKEAVSLHIEGSLCRGVLFKDGDKERVLEADAVVLCRRRTFLPGNRIHGGRLSDGQGGGTSHCAA